jgi:hypothetical protein
VIHENMTLGECLVVLRACGLTIEALARRGQQFTARLAADPAHLPDGATVTSAEGRGASIAEALEDARLGWVLWGQRANRAEVQA